MHTTKNTLYTGEPLPEAKKAIILLHGRGSNPHDMLGIANLLKLDGFAIVAPSAHQNTWYPRSFLAPEKENQPWLDAALKVVHDTILDVEQTLGGSEKIFVLGFSQGACLALESTARLPKKYGGVFALSGGLIGLGVNQREFEKGLDGTPYFLGCSDVDPHIPKDRVLESSNVLKEQGAEVETVLYPNFGHTINQDQIDRVQKVLDAAGE